MRINKSGRLRVKHNTEDINPMEGVGNMADAMLVFALGILLALIISWDVDISEQGEIKDAGTRYNVDAIEEPSAQTEADAEALEEMGKVYRDPETGKYYVVENSAEDGATEGSQTGDDRS